MALDLTGGDGRRARGVRRPNTSSARRARAQSSARGSGAAIASLKSFAKSARSARNMVDYISRDGDLELMDQDGNVIQDAEDRADVLEGWGFSFPEKEGRRFAAHFVLSTPEGSDEQATQRAAREWAAENLFEFDYVGCLHTDTANPHYHLIVARNPDSPLLKWGPGELEDMRESWATIGTDNGIPMVALRRSDRGLRTSAPNSSTYYQRQKVGYTRSDLEAAQEVLAEKDEERADGAQEEREPEQIRDEVEAWIADEKRQLASGELDEAAATAAEARIALFNRHAMALRMGEDRKAHMRALRDNPILKQARGGPMDAKALATEYVERHKADTRIQRPSATGTIRAARSEYYVGAMGGRTGKRIREIEKARSKASAEVRARLDKELETLDARQQFKRAAIEWGAQCYSGARPVKTSLDKACVDVLRSPDGPEKSEQWELITDAAVKTVEARREKKAQQRERSMAQRDDIELG